MGNIWHLDRGVPLRDEDGNIVKWYGVVTDIEDRKRAEHERERLRQLEADLAHVNRVSTLGEMAASLAHEIKQPIAAAITSANTCIEWLAHEPPNLDRARAAAARIDKYGNRAAEIIDRIRSLYKKSPPQRELVDVNGIIQEMLSLLKGEATRYPIAMPAELTTDLPKIMADRVQLQQVFMNLVLNAIEAMKDSGGELTVKSQLQDGQLQFSVSDTGVVCQRRRWIRSFLRSLRPSRKAAAWGWPSAVPLWSPMAAGCGLLPTTDEVQRFISPCRPQPKPCKCPQLERDSVSLGLPRGDTDRRRGSRPQKK
jgi:signal transduction histidine kinase